MATLGETLSTATYGATTWGAALSTDTWLGAEGGTLGAALASYTYVGSGGGSGDPDPTLLPVATTAQTPLTTAYNALSVGAIAAGGSYADPTTGETIHKLTSATVPAASANWGHDYAEGGNEVSLPHTGTTRTVIVRLNGGVWWLLDFTPGTGVSNGRALTGTLAPIMDGSFTFSSDPATPYYAYVSNGSTSTIRRFDVRNMTEATGGGWPVTADGSFCTWLHQSENDTFFTWMRGANGDTVVGYEPSTATKKTHTDANLNEPRIDRAGRYVGIAMSTPQNGLKVWDWQTDTITWTADGTIPYGHTASLKRLWMGVDWNVAFPGEFTKWYPDVSASQARIGGPAQATLSYGNGAWNQSAAVNDQWALYHHYGSLQPTGSTWLAPGGMIFVTVNGGRRLLGHMYNTSATYERYSFCKCSPDGKYVMFTSDMNGSARSDVFLAEVPVA